MEKQYDTFIRRGWPPRIASLYAGWNTRLLKADGLKRVMWCVHCIQPINGVIDHELCKEAVWRAMSEEYTRNREAFKKQYDFAPKGCTVELREPLERSVSR